MVKFRRNIDFKTGIRKVIYQVHSDLKIKSISVDLINDMIKRVCEDIITVANKLAQLGKRKRIGVNEIKSAVLLKIPGELARHAISEAMRNLSPQNNKSKMMFSNAVTLKIMKKNINNGFEIGKTGITFLTSTLEYLTAETLDVSGDVTKYKNTIQIQPRDIMLGIDNDEELRLLFDGAILGTNTIIQMKGGKIPVKNNVYPIRGIKKNALRRLMFKAGVKYASSLTYENSKMILEDIINKMVKATSKIKDYKGNRTFMFEDGKEALRILKINVYSTRGFPGRKRPCMGSEKVKNIESEKMGERRRKPSVNLDKLIKRYRRVQCTLIPHAPIERLIKEVTLGIHKYEPDFTWLIHAACENYIVSIFRDAYLITRHSKRKILSSKDISLAMTLRRRNT